jgi:dihydroxyacetone kinase phosphoprotein-dependent L subunit
MPPATLSDVEQVVRIMAETVVANETYFGELDAVVGDGDFGYSMARGFELVISDWEKFDRTDIATFLRKVAVVITSRVGGTSGPIWGTGFLRAAAGAAGATTVDSAQIVAMLRASVEGIKARGSADLGDKTLLDALVPAIDAIEGRAGAQASAAEAVRAAATAARSAAEATRPMLAKRGRAAYTGERSIGTLDAGAVAVAVLLEALADRWQEVRPTS